MIRALREADRNTTFQFLDLPPELRNLVYAELLTLPEEAQHSGTSRYHPSILATCKQVHDEADGQLNDVADADVCLKIHTRMIRSGSPPFDMQYGLDVFFNGACIFRAGEETRSGVPIEELKWPALLSKVQKIKLRINIESRSKHTSSDITREDSFNHALHWLYIALTQRCNATVLHIEIFSDVHSSFSHLRTVLSPLCTLGERISNTTFNVIKFSEEVADELQETSVAYRGLFALQQEADLASHINTKLYDYRGDVLEDYRWIMCGIETARYYEYADARELNMSIVETGDAIARAAGVKIGEWAADLVDTVEQLKQMRAKRRIQSEGVLN
jgi:hypothetical protein